MAESGIYEIVNLVNGKRYVGSAVNFKRRKIDHWKKLRRGNHHCRHLQFSWNKHGERAFAFQIIEEVCEKGRLIEREQHYIDSLNPEYNTARKAGSCLGIKHRPESIAKRVAKFPKSFGPETRRRVAEAGRRKWAEPGYRERMIKARRAANRAPEARAKKSAASLLSGAMNNIENECLNCGGDSGTPQRSRNSSRSSTRLAKL